MIHFFFTNSGNYDLIMKQDFNAFSKANISVERVLLTTCFFLFFCFLFPCKGSECVATR